MSKISMQPKIGILDFLIGFIIAAWVSDTFIQPLFADQAASYGVKILHWFIVTVVFLVMASGIILLSMWLRMVIKDKRGSSAAKKKR